MRVAMLLDNHHAPDRRVRGEVELLGERGIEVRVLAWDRRAGGQVGLIRRSRSDPHEELVRIEVPAPHGDGLNALRQVARFGRHILRERVALLADCAAVVAHDVYLLPLGWLLARRLRIPLVYDAHEEFGAMTGSRYGHVLRTGVTRLETALARRAAMIVVPGRSRVPRWAAVGMEPLVLPNVGDLTPLERRPPSWDLTYCGMLTAARRIDLLLDLARARPDLKVAVAGTGAWAEAAERAARTCDNLDFLGWSSDPDDLLARSRAVYYGLDPAHPYSSKACPNTLYQALRVGRPLVFHCGGEPADLLARFDIGVRCAADVTALAAAVDDALARDRAPAIAAARTAVEQECRGAQEAYVERMAKVLTGTTRSALGKQGPR